MLKRTICVACGFAALLAAATTSSASAATGTPTIQPQVISDSQLQALTTTFGGGASPLATTQTVPHWWGSTFNPNDGTTYGYNMVGADPNTCTGAACSATVPADITPINVVLDGLTFRGEDVVRPTLDSPVFATNDYGSTQYATQASSLSRRPGGELSKGDAGTALQLEDATMRAQFNQTGSSQYHLKLAPAVHPAITVDVPSGQGTLIESGRGVIAADVNIQWWSALIQNLDGTLAYNDPTHLPIYLTNDVVNFTNKTPTNCCVIGFHGTSPIQSKKINGQTNGNGNQPIQTAAWASYLSPGFYARPNGGADWAVQDIHPLSHEVSEWADDPFVNNTVEPWLTPTAPQYGCTSVMETGDPVVGIGFAMGTNTYDQGPNPIGGGTSSDHYYHPEDEVFLPWFMRSAPNTISEPTQQQTTNGGRYSLMGTLNPFPGFRQPATGCS